MNSRTLNRAHISLDQWLVFTTVLKTGSFTAAAAELNRTQSAVSYAIRKMEELLEAKLFEPDGRNVRSSELAKSLKQPATSLINDAVSLEQFAINRPADLESEINFFVDVIYPNDLLFNALKRFSESFPSVRISLEQGVFSSTIEAVSSGKADLGICPFIPPGFIGKSLAQIEFAPVAQADFALSKKNRTLTLDDLLQHTQIVIKDDSKHIKEIGSLGGEYRWAVTNFESAIISVKAGIGFAWIATHLIEEELKSGELTILPLEGFGVFEQPLHLVFGKSAPGHGCKALADILLAS